MKICVIGTGYVGLVVGTCFAEMGNEVTCVDINEAKIGQLKRGKVPIYEPGLEELIERNVFEKRLVFSTRLKEAVRQSLVVFIAVGTPSNNGGASDLKHVLAAIESVGRAMNGYKIIVNKSTVPVGTADKVRAMLARLTRHPFDVASNPEFLKEGAAVDDFMRPDRIIIGTGDVRVAELLKELYRPFVRTGAPILVMDTRSAEMTKYAANAMLAARISFMNEIANLCEVVGADVHWVRQGIGTDHRIGNKFLFPVVGYGGSCFPKDVQALLRTSEEFKVELRIVRSVQQVNERQKTILVEKILKHFEVGKGRSGRALAGKRFGVWGLSFKPQTDDVRESPALAVVLGLLEAGAKVRAYDPEAIDAARKVLGSRIQYARTSYDALEGCDALILLTEWNMFRNPDFERMKKMLKTPVVFDGRNQYDPVEMTERGFLYYAIGRPQPIAD